MTRIEAIKQLESLLSYCKVMLKIDEIWKPDYEALNIVIAALRGPTREQVEAWKGDWIDVTKAYNDVPQYKCSRCGKVYIDLKQNFCRDCGAPMTDEAVEIVMKRLEALKVGSTD